MTNLSTTKMTTTAPRAYEHYFELLSMLEKANLEEDWMKKSDYRDQILSFVMEYENQQLSSLSKKEQKLVRKVYAKHSDSSWTISDAIIDVLRNSESASPEKIKELVLLAYEISLSYENKHFILMHAYNSKDVFSENEIIELMKLDVKIFDNFKVELETGGNDVPSSYPSFKKLAITYFKQERYEDVINISNRAISHSLGDATKGGFQARIDKSIRKLNK